MYKQELIHLHSILVCIKRYLENNGVGEFTEYQKLQISPQHTYRSKADHKYAILILGSELAKATSTYEMQEPNQLSIRLRELAKQYLKLDLLEGSNFILYQLLKDRKPQRLAEISRKVGQRRKNIYVILWSLMKEGLVSRGIDGYYLTTEGNMIASRIWQEVEKYKIGIKSYRNQVVGGDIYWRAECPHCHSHWTGYRKTSGSWRCRKCGNVWMNEVLTWDEFKAKMGIKTLSEMRSRYVPRSSMMRDPVLRDTILHSTKA